MEGSNRFEELARRLAARTKQLSQGADARPALALVAVTPRPTTRMDHILRESHCRMIRHFRRSWGHPMQLLIDQACFGYAGIEQLPDDELVELHRDLERAMDCIREGVSFEDAGLLRARYG